MRASKTLCDAVVVPDVGCSSQMGRGRFGKEARARKEFHLNTLPSSIHQTRSNVMHQSQDSWLIILGGICPLRTSFPVSFHCEVRGNCRENVIIEINSAMYVKLVYHKGHLTREKGQERETRDHSNFSCDTL